ncbi:MAG: DNA-directed RNA polymerase subunit delta [Firmicutes bacterium]|nr:DNA-directed RNA polymerase subunit delta [Bacillota bacterium]
MSIKKMSKEELELLSNKDITNLLLEESKKPINTADLFKKIIELLELPKKTFEDKIADYYTALATDKRFILLEDGTWDLRSRYKSDKVVKVSDEEDEEEDEEIKEEIETSDIDEEDEDNYDDKEDEYDDDTNEELKDLVIIDEDELELE